MAKLKRRLDHELYEQGLFDSIDAAQRAVMAAQVFDEQSRKRYDKAGEMVEVGARFYLRSAKKQKDMRDRFVSRGGAKLQTALQYFSCKLEGLSCLDIGCSTGGFTDCALQHGARHICAVDVGYGQFDWTLRNDERVDLHERTNICKFAQDIAYEKYWHSFDYIFADLSFTSLSRIMEAVALLLSEDGYFLSLIKPQFEAERSQVGAGGIVQDKQVHREVLMKLCAELDEAAFQLHGLCSSGITGIKGNREFFVLASKRSLSNPLYPVLSTAQLHEQIRKLSA